ncbi:MAG: tRNA 2-thiouridine(34) synthase MnmA [Patescibacteria group bacterium]
MKNNNKKVYIGLSGGVDSAVSVYLLKKQGFDVCGVYMKNWTGTHLNLAGECKWTYERDDAKKVAQFLKIPFEVWDFEKEYRRDVIDYFFKEYARGRTPNPDIRCNQFVKIPLFLKRALGSGADFIATGHYARKSEILNPVKGRGPHGTLRPKSQKIEYKLLNGIDNEKDQSYFLCTLTQYQLKHILFPVGGMTKIQVRQLAKKLKLPVAAKPDSVGICFIGEVKVKDFLRTRLQENPGPIVDTNDRVLGKHIGLTFYTIGQRHGLRLAGGPWYVIGRKWKANTLIVGKLVEQKYLLASKFIAEKVHWVAGTAPKLPATFLVRHRYRHPVFLARVSKAGDKLRVKFVEPQRAITPGQSAVFYKAVERGVRSDLYVLGSAVIEKVEKKGFIW